MTEDKHYHIWLTSNRQTYMRVDKPFASRATAHRHGQTMSQGLFIFRVFQCDVATCAGGEGPNMDIASAAQVADRLGA